MTSRIRHLTIDSHDPFALATFRAEVLGGRLDDDDHPGDPEAIVHGCDPELLFVTVPEGKQVKNPGAPRRGAARRRDPGR